MMKKMSCDDLIISLGILLQIVQKYMFIPGKVENWLVLIDTNKISLWSLPLKVIIHVYF